jgi:uncharacterized protein
MRVYLDASAAAKLLVAEAESEPLRGYLSQLDEAYLVSSVLLETELRRMAARKGAPQSEVTPILQRIHLIAAPRALFQEAGVLPGSGLRALDALHVATALRVSSDAVLAYDRRLIQAARACGFPTVSPA